MAVTDRNVWIPTLANPKSGIDRIACWIHCVPVDEVSNWTPPAENEIRRCACSAATYGIEESTNSLPPSNTTNRSCPPSRWIETDKPATVLVSVR